MSGSRSSLIKELQHEHKVHVPVEVIDKIRSKFTNNYFGLPPYAMQASPVALAYQCRKPMEANLLTGGDHHSMPSQGGERQESRSRAIESFTGEKAEINYVAQRKVASALLTMVSNPLMLKHFLHKGGFEALLKLVDTAKDTEVLMNCGQCLVQISSSGGGEHCKYLVDKGIFSGISSLIDYPDDNVKHYSAVILAKLSFVSELEELLLMNGALQQIQLLLSHAHRTDTICYLIMSLCNLSTFIVQNEAELVVRMTFQATKKIDIVRSLNKAKFVADLYCNFTRLGAFTSLLVDEGLLPFFITMMESHNSSQTLLSATTEALANMSINRKNRREISGSGIAQRLSMLFDRGDPIVRSFALLIMGNLLSPTSTNPSANATANSINNSFHEKVATPEILSNIMDNLLDIHVPKQFNAVSYCLYQLSMNENSREVMVSCQVIPIVLGYLQQSPKDSIDYLWAVLVNIAKYPQFFSELTQNSTLLLNELYDEVRNEVSTFHQQTAVVNIAFALAKERKFKQCLLLNTGSTSTASSPKKKGSGKVDFANDFNNDFGNQKIDLAMLELFVKTIKVLFASSNTDPQVQLASMIVLIHLANNIPESRSVILSTDLIDLMTKKVGLEHEILNVRYAALLNVISNEEICCYKLLELNVHKLLVAMQESFMQLSTSKKSGLNNRKKSLQYVKGKSISNLSNMMASQRNNSSISLGESLNSVIGGDSDFNHSGNLSTTGGGDYSSFEEGELGKELTAAIVHNIALKRPLLAPGVLSMMMSLSKNCGTIRVLHCVRAMASMSVHSKAKVAIAKESRKIIPMLTIIMRSGCAEAEKVQYYCAIILCNVLALSLEKSLLVELAKDRGAVEDLIVVTLLRINAMTTKETLGKTFFNLLARAEVREALVLQRDILSAILELAKIKFIDLLELCMRAFYNITCELKPGSGVDVVYSAKLQQLKIPSMMITRLVYGSGKEQAAPGSMTNRTIRLLLGMALANMSFHKQLVLDIVNVRVKVSEPPHPSAQRGGGSASPDKAAAAASTASTSNTTTMDSSNAVAKALYRIYSLGTEESTYCACVTLFNISRVIECRKLAGSKAVDLVNEVLSSAGTASVSVMVTKLCVSTMCNFSLMAEFHDQLTLSSIPCLVNILSSPQVHMSIKMDAIQAVYNLVTLCQASRAVLIQHDIIAAIWKLMKVSPGKNATGNKDDNGSTATPIATASQSAAESSVAAADDDEEGDDNEEERLFLLVGQILKDLCEDVSDIILLRKLMNDGIMNILLKLSKIELADVKVSMAFCMYSLTKGVESMKVLKRDSVDILFWLTLQDMLGSMDLIMRNVSRAMRSFSTGAEESKVLIKQERFFSVLKQLVKSRNEDVLWQTAGMLYNVMRVEVCRKKLLERGLIGFIFELASSGYDHVKHVCSACLHMVPDNLPNIDDPMALDLVLCLLDAQGDKFSEISEKPMDVLAFPLEPMHRNSPLVHTWSNFTASWNPFTCIVETVFIPSYVAQPVFNIDVHVITSDPTSISSTDKHRKMTEVDYDHFKRDASELSPLQGNSSVYSTDNHDRANPNVITLNAPPVLQLRPPSSIADFHQPGGGHHLAVTTGQVHSSRERDNSTHYQALANKHGAGGALKGSTGSNLNSPVVGSSHKQIAAPLSSAGTNSNFMSPLHSASGISLPQVQTSHSSQKPKVSFPLLKTSQPLPENTVDVIRKSTSQLPPSGGGSKKKGNGGMVGSASADFSPSSFSYHPVLGNQKEK